MSGKLIIYVLRSSITPQKILRAALLTGALKPTYRLIVSHKEKEILIINAVAREQAYLKYR